MAILAETSRYIKEHVGASSFHNLRNRNPDSNEYVSLLSIIPRRQKNKDLIPYDGSLDMALDDLTAALKEPLTKRNALLLARNPLLITRALIEMNIAEAGRKEYEDLIRKSVNVAQMVYQREKEAPASLSELSNTIFSLGESVYRSEIKVEDDDKTLEATDPGRSKKAAELLYKLLEGKPVLCIPLGHGGTMAGLEVFVRYQKLSGTKDGTFYPLRFSKYKKEDFALRYTESERDYLRQEADGREIVIFEEDINTGDTHREAKLVAEQALFPGRTVTMVANYTEMTGNVEINYDRDNIIYR